MLIENENKYYLPKNCFFFLLLFFSNSYEQFVNKYLYMGNILLVLIIINILDRIIDFGFYQT
jgi:hypothetical protein